MSQTYDKVNLLRSSVETPQPPIRIVPNPFSIASDISRLRFGSTVGDRIAFFNIPGQCKIRIYTETGELIQEICIQTAAATSIGIPTPRLDRSS